MNLGILGGSFNPPHVAHQQLVRTAVEQLALDKLLIMPAGKPPHKKPYVVSDTHRLAMCHLAFDHVCDNPRCQIEIDEREMLWARRDGRASYTCNTLEDLRRQYPHDALFFLLGGDSLATLPTWEGWPHMLQLSHFAFAARPHTQKESARYERREDAAEVNTAPPMLSLVDALQNPLPWAVYLSTGTMGAREKAGRVIALDMSPTSVSSSAIRTKLAARAAFTADISCNPQEIGLPHKVYEYIAQHGLYDKD